MIVVTVDYDHGWGTGDEIWDTNSLTELRDSVEAIVGLIFAEELNHVDVRIRPFGEYDQYEEPVFFTIDVDESELILGTAQLGQQFVLHMSTHLHAMFSTNIPFRVWVRRITGSYVETGNTNNR